jgi:hypothetical protein
MKRIEKMMKPLGLGLSVGLLCSTVIALAQEAEVAPPAPAGEVYIISPSDGGVVSSPVLIQFGLSGMGVAPAGVEKENTGHHHLIVDGDMSPAGRPIPKNDTYRHFGGGQTEAMIELAPGTHTLQLLLGDHLHIPHEAPVASDQITITVE